MKEALKEKKEQRKPGSFSEVSLSLYHIITTFKLTIFKETYIWQAGILLKLSHRSFWCVFLKSFSYWDNIFLLSFLVLDYSGPFCFSQMEMQGLAVIQAQSRSALP